MPNNEFLTPRGRITTPTPPAAPVEYNFEKKNPGVPFHELSPLVAGSP